MFQSVMHFGDFFKEFFSKKHGNTSLDKPYFHENVLLLCSIKNIHSRYQYQ